MDPTTTSATTAHSASRLPPTSALFEHSTSVSRYLKMARRRGAAPRPAPRAPPSPRPASTQSHSQFQRPPPPAPHAPAPPPAMPSQGGGMMSGLGGMVVQGMALGTGSALAHRAVDSVLGSRHPEPAQAQAAAEQLVAEKAPCSEQAKLFADCMSWSQGDMDSCQQYFQAMQQCRVQTQGAMA